MLKTTLELIAHLQTTNRNNTIISSLVRAIVRCGGKEDAFALLEQFKTQPFDFYHSFLFPVFERHGNREIAAEIYKACIPGHHQVSPPEVLELFGQLHYEPARKLLTHFAFNSSDYYLSKYAVLGLLQFDLDDLAGDIIQAIEGTYGKNHFPEFLPALVSKVRNREEMLARLYESGSTVCSTDSNAGILLGFALCGEEGLPWFKKALFNPAWEANNTSTGTAFWAYKGLVYLGIGIGELAREVAQLHTEEQKVYGSRVLLSLLEQKLSDHFTDHQETFAAVYLTLFGNTFGSNESTFTELVALAGLQELAERLEELLELKVHEEAVLRSCMDEKNNIKN